ncbi:MAG: hypothetical protein H7281_14245 [Bacteriovorax sp.]|nr:hypothetical protein [Bacteriovorax sp.]
MNFCKLCCLVFFLLSNAVFAKSEGHILSASTNSALEFNKGTYSDSYNATFNLDVGYDYAFANGLQLGGNFETIIYSHSSVWKLGAGPAYNFNHKNIENSFFAGLKVGTISTHYGSYTNISGFISIEGGKRFRLMENVSYVPGVIVEKILGSNTPDASFAFEFFRLSLIF